MVVAVQQSRLYSTSEFDWRLRTPRDYRFLKQDAERSIKFSRVFTGPKFKFRSWEHSVNGLIGAVGHLYINDGARDFLSTRYFGPKIEQLGKIYTHILGCLETLEKVSPTNINHSAIVSLINIVWTSPGPRYTSEPERLKAIAFADKKKLKLPEGMRPRLIALADFRRHLGYGGAYIISPQTPTTRSFSDDEYQDRRARGATIPEHVIEGYRAGKPWFIHPYGIFCRYSSND